MNIWKLSLLLGCCVAAIACTESRVVIGGDAGDASMVDGSTGDGAVISCGSATCATGQVCCNESCGICAAPGEPCITLECTEPVVCNGTACEGAAAVCCAGCDGAANFCSGPGGACPDISCPPTCGGDTCGDGEVCCDACGEERCLSGDACALVDCAPSCDELDCRDGNCCVDCDGTGYCAGDAPCPDIACPECEAQDARSDGTECLFLLGYAFNGDVCEEVVCGCEGADCDAIFPEYRECVRAYGSCGAATPCTGDTSCDDTEYCDPCAHGSCMGCDDCVSACVPHMCTTPHTLTCRALRPECGETGTAVVGPEGCWECVDAATCEPADCRMLGCDEGSYCGECGTAGGSVWTCIPDGAAC